MEYLLYPTFICFIQDSQCVNQKLFYRFPVLESQVVCFLQIRSAWIIVFIQDSKCLNQKFILQIPSAWIIFSLNQLSIRNSVFQLVIFILFIHFASDPKCLDIGSICVNCSFIPQSLSNTAFVTSFLFLLCAKCQ